MRITQIVRDVLILFALTFMGGFVIGAAVGSSFSTSVNAQFALIISNFLFSVVGFCISGALAKINRFKHLIVVAVVFWVCSAANMLIAPLTFAQWAFSIVFILVTMGIGGALSFVFVKAPSGAKPNAA